ncbi:TetR/AcrR family transcriptional regulator [Fredinandcohnia sp. 179-A 10B2 NHS]|uniref:TetR/AcrR family transcriptional regulator n=1 Tax=Fredinandcohnia sp. 179-A 10B2 NHS TaxID=3235176 RepID=UPI00399F4E16
MSKDNMLDALIEQTKRSKKQTDKQQKIVETAIKMFAEKGYANTSTSEIAKIAGVAEGTIFRHYGTKDNLLLSVILPFIKEALPSMADNVFKEVIKDESIKFDDFLRGLIKNRIEFVMENREIFQVLVKELMYSEQLRKELFPHFSEVIVKRISTLVEKYKERREIINLPTETLVRMFFTLFGGYLVSNFILFSNRQEINVDVEVENLVMFVMNGIGSKNQEM